jgi:predicted ATPase
VICNKIIVVNNKFKGNPIVQFDIGIRNFGKINDAKIKIRPFTVIAGKNSSGKSFVTKSLDMLLMISY